MANNSEFLGWKVEFKDSTNDYKYDTEIVDLAIGEDVSSCYPMCTIKFSVDTSFIKYLSHPHAGTLTLINKMVYTEESDEIFTIDLESVTNPSSILEREEDVSRSNITLVVVRYMCLAGSTLMNRRVGGIFHKKKLEEIINDLYKQTESKIPLKMEKLDNKTKYDCIMVQQSSFIESIRYLNQQYGLYNNMFLMFGETFTDKSAQWVINNANKIKRDKVELYFTPYEQATKHESYEIDSHKYYTYMPIHIRNNFVQLAKKVPKMIKFISLDNDKFMKRKDIKVESTINKLNFLKSNEQFKKELEIKEEMYSSPRFDVTNYALNDKIQQVGISAYQMPDITVPNPIKLSHFQIGTKVKFISQTQGFMEADVQLMVLGYLLRIKQGNGVGGGATWSTTLKIRTCATSYLKQ